MPISLNNKARGMQMVKTKKYKDLFDQVSFYLHVINKLDSYIVIITYLGAFINAVTPYVKFYLLGRLVDVLLNKDVYSAVVLSVILLVFSAITKLISSIITNAIGRKRQSLFANFKSGIYEHYLQLEYSTAEKAMTKEKMSVANSMVDMYGGVEELINRVGNLMEALISIISAIFILGEFMRILFVSKMISAQGKVFSSALIVASILIHFLLVRAVSLKHTAKTKTLINRHGNTENLLDYYLSHIYTDSTMLFDIKMFGMDNLVKDKFGEFVSKSSQYYKEEYDNIIGLNTKTGFLDVLANVVSFCVIARCVFLSVITAGLYTKYYSSFLNLIRMTACVATELDGIERTCGYLQAYKEFIGLRTNGDEDLKKCNSFQVIQLHDVSYKYPGTDRYVLKHINLTLEVGKNVALVGRNGAGKSTLVKLICGLYKPTSGYITVDKIRMEDIKDSFRERVGTVFQECVLFPFTISENIACASWSDDCKVQKCLSEAGILEKIVQLPQKCETDLMNMDSDGFGFSGGERQKLVIARALYRDGRCMILDEPASALDVISENELYESFSNLTKDKIGVLVSHRMSGCTLCDYIIVIDDGEVECIGKHSDLLKSNQLYKKLWNAQAKYYKEHI